MYTECISARNKCGQQIVLSSLHSLWLSTERMHRSLLPLAVLLIATFGCNLGRPAAKQSESGPTASAVTFEPDIPIAAMPIRLTIPGGLATGASAETIDVVTDQTGATWDIVPAHLQLTFQGYALGSTFHVPQLFVYPAQQYAAMNPAAAETVKRLQTVIAHPSVRYGKDTLPRVPFLNAGQVLAVQQRIEHFTGGSGVRFVTQYGQDVSPLNNSGLFYHFAGLSDDGKFYMVAILPVSLPFLAADNDPSRAVPAGGIPFPAPSASPDDFNNYYSQIAARIDATAPDQFSPSLAILDALIQSISVDR